MTEPVRDEGMATRAMHERFDDFFARARQQGQAVALIVDDRLPQYDRHAGGLGMYHYAKLFCDLGFAVVFIPHDRKRLEPYGSALRRLGIEVGDGPFDFAAWIARYGGAIGVVWLSRPNVAVRYFDAIRAASRARILYCGHDLHFLRLRRQAEIEGRPELYATARRAAMAERWLIARADATLTFSEVERQLISELFGIRNKVHIVPAYTYDDLNPRPCDLPAAARSDILFIGFFPHRPNVDAAMWFVKEVWPLVAPSVPEARLVIVGTDAERLAIPPRQRLRVAGYVPDLDPYFARAKLSVAPLRYGAGVKGKIVASLARGVPVVATRVGAEGMGLTNGVNTLLADEPAAFAAQIRMLWQNERLWAQLSAAGRDYVAKNYSRERAHALLAGILMTLGVSPVLAR